MVISLQSFDYKQISFFHLCVSSFLVSVAGQSFTISKYEPLILQRKVGHIFKFQSNVKPTMMPNPRGFFVVNNHKMYVDFWTQGRHFKLTVNRGSPAVVNDMQHQTVGSINNSSTINELNTQDLDFFTGYLNDNPRLEAYGYISTTRTGDETLVFTINLGTDTLHIENSEYIADNNNWFNTVAYLRRDVAMKDLGESPFRSRHLLDESSQEVVDYYNKVEQYNYSNWDNRPLSRVRKVCGLNFVSDHRVLKYLADFPNNVYGFHLFASTMGYFFYRRHDLDMDGIADHFAFSKFTSFRLSSIDGLGSPWKQLNKVLHSDDNDHKEWLKSLAAINRELGKRSKCSMVGFTMENMKGTNGASSDALCCDGESSVIVNLKRLVTPSNAALVYAHHVARLIGAKDDPKKCTEDNKNIKLGKYLSHADIQTNKNANNMHLSPCAMIDIHKKIQDIYNRNNCLTYSFVSELKCGNGIREDDEVCDCGDIVTCHKTDKCCTPTGAFDLRPCTIDNVTVNERTEGNKTINYTYECSGKSQECCNEDCLIVSDKERKQCGTPDECHFDTYCNGVSPVCPISKARDDGFSCKGDSQICINGSCVENICAFHDLQSCICKDANSSCALCCEFKNETSIECVPSQLFAKDVKLNGTKYFQRKNGSSCGSKGICINGRCDEQEERDETNATTNVTTEMTTHITTEMTTHITTEMTTVQEVLEHVDVECDDWYCRYWYILLAVTLALMILIPLFTLCHKKLYKTRKVKKFNNHVTTAQGQLAGDAQLQKAPPEATVKASRLLALFPTVPQAEIIQTATGPETEEDMVWTMLENGHPMRRITG